MESKEVAMKAIIYLRTSTKEQNPELQRKDCLDFCMEKGLEVVDVISEQMSAYNQEKARPEWNKLVERIKSEKLNLVVWRYDRSFRNREEFFKFMKIMFEVYGVKIYSVKEPSILSFWGLMDKSHTSNPIFNELLNGIFKALWDFMIQQAGEQAEEESKKKSERVRNAVRIEDGVTKSYKGNKWGRKEIPKSVVDKVLELHALGKKYREICKEVFYWDSSRNKKSVSLGVVHKIIKQNSSKDGIV